MSFIEDFTDRGYLYQCTDLSQLSQLMSQQKIAAYVGFDCTAKSLHVGNLVQIMMLRLFQQHGHKPIIIIGGGTTKIGDPTGREETRKVLTAQELASNMAGIKQSLEKFITFGSGVNDAIMLNNAQWLEPLNYLDFLSNYGRYFSVNRMLTMDSIKARLERQQSLTFLEFNYMLVQAYDFYYLNKNYHCQLQFGGSDQWGNIVMGVELIRKLTSLTAYGLTTPLLTTSSGAKMGKSAGAAVWLNDDMLSSYDYYQYWRNCADSDVLRFAKLYAEFDQPATCQFAQLTSQDINAAKKQLALRLTTLCRGQAAAELSAQTAIATFEKGQIDDNLLTIFIDAERLAAGILASQLFFEAGLAGSKSEGRRLITSGAAKINDLKLDQNIVIDQSFMQGGRVIKLTAGKKKHILVKHQASPDDQP